MVSIAKDVEDAFYAGVRSATVPFVINDCVVVVGGPRSGSGGAVICIEAIEPSLRLRVELGDGADIVVEAADLRRVPDT
jgi:hypothetical protein